MANNRMYLRCTGCERDAFSLAKWYPSIGWFWTSAEGTSDDLKERLNNWLDEHQACALKLVDGDCISLVYENSTPGAPLSLYPSKQGS